MHYVTPRGVPIPALGFGTFRLNGEVAKQMVGHALAIGYRHVDTARMYGNEAEVGAAIAGSPVPRDQIWLTTKIWPDSFRAGDLQQAAEKSVRRLGTEPDLLLLHWPNPRVRLVETIGALNDVRDRGLARNIGVSNFTTALLAEALAVSTAPLLVDQVEYHPYLAQRAVLGALRANDMALIAYAPIAHGKVFADRTLVEIGARHGKNGGQVALRWLIQQDGVVAIPRSSRPAHAEANFAIFDFELSGAEMAEIGSLGSPAGRLIDPGGMAPAWDRD
jgi:2,5-diketo-D-gluconate reductase B